MAELIVLPAQLATELRRMGLDAASAGTYPMAVIGKTRISHHPRVEALSLGPRLRRRSMAWGLAGASSGMS